jgi:hypothetical protein
MILKNIIFSISFFLFCFNLSAQSNFACPFINAGPDQTFDCLDPWFKLLPETTVSMNAYSSGFTFPFSFPVYFGLSGNVQTINNTGQIPTPITIEMSGIKSPVLTRSTDKISLDVDLTSTETVTIKTDFGIKSVIKVAGTSTTNEYSHLSVDSNLFYLNKRQ